MAAAQIEMPQAAANRFLGSLRTPSHILVAISGGSDSTGLLLALADAIASGLLPHRLSAVTVDHALRPESAEEARAVDELCIRLGVPHRTSRWEGDKPRSGLMAAAREARYDRLADEAASVGANLIVTGHTFDDQQETLAMRRARLPQGQAEASGGIADAVLFDRRIWVVRPFLACLRRDIRAFLSDRAVGWIDDPSNEDLHYERVRVRESLADAQGIVLPNIGGEGADSLSAEAAYWVGRSVHVYEAVLARIDPRGIDVGSPVFRRGLSYLAASLGGQPFGLGMDRLERVLAFIGEGKPGRRTAGGVVFDLRRDGLYLMRESRNIRALALAPGAAGVWDGRFDVANGSRYPVQIVAAGGSSSRDFPTDVPNGAAMRAAAAAPAVRFEEDIEQNERRKVEILPRLAPFDRFLTRSALDLADRLASSFGRSPYLSPPL